MNENAKVSINLRTAESVALGSTLVGGKNYGDSGGPLYITETYPLLVGPSGTELMVCVGKHGIVLPFISQRRMNEDAFLWGLEF